MLPDQDFTKKVIAGEEAIQAIFPVLTQSVCSRIPTLSRSAIILDIGGSSGLWLETFRAAGFTQGILVEPRRDQALFAAERWRRLRLSAKNSPSKMNAFNYFPVMAMAEALPFVSDKIQLIISRNSLHLWKNIPLGIANMARVLQSGGFAFIGRGFGPDLSHDIRDKVKENRTVFSQQYYTDDKAEPPSPEAEEVVSIMMKSGFQTATIIPDRKSWWILAGK